MQNALATEGRLLAEELYRLIQALDPAVFRADLVQSIREMAEALARRLRKLRAEASVGLHDIEAASLAAFREALDGIGRQLDELRERASLGRREGRSAFKALQARYDALRRGLTGLASDAAKDLPTLRATNVTRSLFHMANGFVSLACLQLLPTWGVLVVAGSFVTAAWTAETIRQFSPAANEALMRLFSPVAHPHEYYKVNSATWYATALILLAVFAPYWAASVAVTVLGLADPAAAFFGRRYGRIRLMHGRSLEGSTAFVIVGFLSALAVLGIFYPDFGFGRMVAAAAAAGVIGAIAELVSGKGLDDNLSVPLAAGLATWLVLAG